MQDAMDVEILVLSCAAAFRFGLDTLKRLCQLEANSGQVLRIRHNLRGAFRDDDVAANQLNIDLRRQVRHCATGSFLGWSGHGDGQSQE